MGDVIRGFLLLVAAVSLGGPFGVASAQLLEREPTGMIIDLEVEVRVSVQAVVAHLSFDQEPELKLPLLDRGNGVFGLTTELAPRNYVVVFDAIGPRGGISDPVTLHQLGVDLVSGSGGSATTAEEGLSEATQSVGWLALAFGAASLAALAVWVLGGGDVEDQPEGAEGEESEGAEEE